MNEIYTRRSMRKFTGEPVSDELVRTVIKAGMNAPSGKNLQPWHFYVLKSRDLIEKIVADGNFRQPLAAAGFGIMVCGDRSIADNPTYLFINCAAATQNILLEAESQGLASCWLGIAPKLEDCERMRSLCGLPEHILPVYFVALGYGEYKKDPNDRFLEDRIHVLD